MISLPPDEVSQLLRDSPEQILHNLAIVPGALPPSFILTSSLQRHTSGEPWFWCAPRLFVLVSERCIVGSGCFKNAPRDGAVEIGCGVAESYRNRSFATQGITLLVAEGFTKTEVTLITAETAIWNIASQRTMEKALFERTGWRIDPEDGMVASWRRTRSTS